LSSSLVISPLDCLLRALLACVAIGLLCLVVATTVSWPITECDTCIGNVNEVVEISLIFYNYFYVFLWDIIWFWDKWVIAFIDCKRRASKSWLFSKEYYLRHSNWFDNLELNWIFSIRLAKYYLFQCKVFYWIEELQ